jgi:ubiquinone/menaquinone biosynthesis C-methylase UbiE
VSDKHAVREAWSLGDYHAFAMATVWELGAVLCDACGISPGQRVLDVAAGSGNTALRAAEAGSQVVASDLTPACLEAGRREADRRGLALEWVEADAEQLPFADGAFDVVTSSVGAMWAPGQQAVADELVRVCRPGGTIGLISFTPEGLITPFLQLFGPYMPASDAPSPALWGSEAHVRELFGDRVELVELARREYVEHATSPVAYCAFYKATFGPAVAVYRSLAGDPSRVAALDRDLLAFATHHNSGPPGGAAEYRFEYLLVVARKTA